MKRIFRHILAGMLALSLSVWGGPLAIGASAEQPSAQATGALEGLLKDPNGQVLAGLSSPVTATNAVTGKVYSTKVERNGHYAIGDLPPGNYDLTLTPAVPMYANYERKGIAIVAGQTLKLDLPIQWGRALGQIGDDPYILDSDLRAQSHYVDGPTPRTAAGHPDLGGEWAPFPGDRGQGAFGAGVDGAQASGGPPMKPWAQAIAKKLQAAMRPQKGKPGIAGSNADCLPQTATPVRQEYPWEFIQTSTRLIQLTGFDQPAHREIYLDGRPHPNPDLWSPSWVGHSVGHWEDDTLVVDTVGFNDITAGYGIHTEALHVVERITRPTVGHLVDDITATDPKAWTGPFHTRVEAGLVTGDEILEYVCIHGGGLNPNEGPHFGGSWYTTITKLMETVPPSVLEDDPNSQGGKKP